MSGQAYRSLTAFEGLCSLSQIPRHMLLLIYKEILSHTHGALPT